MTDRQKAVQDAWERGHAIGLRVGRIEARAELNAEWRERISNVLAILQKPIPTQKESE